MKNFIEFINEDRRPGLVYIEKNKKVTNSNGKKEEVLDRVILELKGHNAGQATKLAKIYYNLDMSIKRMEIQKERLNKIAKRDIFPTYFNLADDAVTKVLETATWVETLSKKTEERTEKVKVIDYEKAFSKLIDMIKEKLEPSLLDIESLMANAIKEATKIEDKVTKATEPKLSVKPKLQESFISNAMDYIKNLISKIKANLFSFDKDFDKLKKEFRDGE